MSIPFDVPARWADRAWLTWLCAASAFALAGCAGLQPDVALTPVQQAARDHLGHDLLPLRSAADSDRAAQRVAELLAEPLSADAAVQLALLNNRALHARLEALGIADADAVLARRLPNPRLGLARLQRGSERETDRSLGFNLGQLLLLPWTLPQAREVDARRLAALQRRVTQDMLGVAAEVRRAQVRAVAAQQALRYQRDVLASTEAGTELARRMLEAGNWPPAQRAREQAIHTEALLAVARAELVAIREREQLTRLLGLSGAQTTFTLPERLPDLPDRLPAPGDPRGDPPSLLPSHLAGAPDVASQALAQRLDVQAARLETEALARELGLSRVTGALDAIEFSVVSNRSSEVPVQHGVGLGFELPLFDWSGARSARAEALYRQSAHRTAQIAVEARSELREAEAAVRSHWAIARQLRDEVVPAARRLTDDSVLRYNGMLIGVFELLADARAQVVAVNAALDAQRDFWLAQADLEQVRLGKAGPSGPAAGLDAGAQP
ncbi:MAG: TolC family protein [Leptothrix sp. (in: b-proteobacteria)]